MHQYLHLDHVLACNGIESPVFDKNCLIVAMQPHNTNNWTAADVHAIRKSCADHSEPATVPASACPELRYVTGTILPKQVGSNPVCSLPLHQPPPLVSVETFAGPISTKTLSPSPSSPFAPFLSGAISACICEDLRYDWPAFCQFLLSKLLEHSNVSFQEGRHDHGPLRACINQLSSFHSIPTSIWAAAYVEAWRNPALWERVEKGPVSDIAMMSSSIPTFFDSPWCCKDGLVNRLSHGLVSALQVYANGKVSSEWFARLKHSTDGGLHTTHESIDTQQQQSIAHPESRSFSPRVVLRRISGVLQHNPTRCAIMASTAPACNNSVGACDHVLHSAVDAACVDAPTTTTGTLITSITSLESTPSAQNCLMAFALAMRHSVPVLHLRSAHAIVSTSCGQSPTLGAPMALINDVHGIIGTVLSSHGWSLGISVDTVRELSAAPLDDRALYHQLQYTVMQLPQLLDAICVQLPYNCSGQAQYSTLLAVIQVIWIMLRVGKRLVVVCSDHSPEQEQFAFVLSVASILRNAAPMGFAPHVAECISTRCCGGGRNGNKGENDARHFVFVFQKRHVAIVQHPPIGQLLVDCFASTTCGLHRNHLAYLYCQSRGTSDVEQVLQVARRPPFDSMKVAASHITREMMWHASQMCITES